jgi:cysteine desulfurase family protein
MIYLDYAATSWPKPPEVIRAMADFLETAGGNPGRSGHRLSIAAARYVYATREAVAELFNIADPERVVFASNVTYALNLALRGLLRPGDHIVTSSMEHNSIMRPLRALEREGVCVTVVACDAEGRVPLEKLRQAVTPGTRMVAVTHASNVTGTLFPLKAIAAIAHQAGALLLVDAAQTAGVVPIDQPALGIDLLAFTGHKGLHGPPGTGGLFIGEQVDLEQFVPLARGGTGSRSELEEQPEMLPDKYESGTGNGVGVAGLGAGIRYILERGVAAIQAHEAALTDCLLEGLAQVPGLTQYGPCRAADRTAVVSCRVAGRRVSEIGLALDDDYAILCRVGLHCAPAAHKTLGTFPEGTIRLAPGLQTSLADIQAVVTALARISSRYD